MKERSIKSLIFGASALAVTLSPALADSPTYKNTTAIPANIVTPDRTETRIGTLEFVDGVPTPDTSQKLRSARRQTCRHLQTI